MQPRCTRSKLNRSRDESASVAVRKHSPVSRTKYDVGLSPSEWEEVVWSLADQIRILSCELRTAVGSDKKQLLLRQARLQNAQRRIRQAGYAAEIYEVLRLGGCQALLG
jgi:hypothetical protein